MLIYRMVQEAGDRERELLKKKGKRVGKGRPGYVTKTAELLGVSRETVSAWKRRRYQAENVNAAMLVEKAWSLNQKETAKILQEDLQSHREKLQRFLKTVDSPTQNRKNSRSLYIPKFPWEE